MVVHYNAGEERAAQIAAAIRAEHAVEALVLGADLSQPEAPFDLVDRTFAHFGRLDVAVSNSGVANYVADEQGQLVPPSLQRHPGRAPRQGDGARPQPQPHGGPTGWPNAPSSTWSNKPRKKPIPLHRSILLITSISDIAPREHPHSLRRQQKPGLNHVVAGAAFDGGPHNITVNALRPRRRRYAADEPPLGRGKIRNRVANSPSPRSTV